MKRIVLFMLISVISLTSFSQEKQKTEKGTAQNKTDVSKENLPNESWKVNKELDENGNIVRYDSIYTWSFSNFGSDSAWIDIDSLMNSFHSFFNMEFPDIWQHGFGNPIWSDSLFPQDFFHDDYLFNRWQDDFFDMEKMIKQMDSLRMMFFEDENLFFYDTLPPPSKPKKVVKT